MTRPPDNMPFRPPTQQGRAGVEVARLTAGAYVRNAS